MRWLLLHSIHNAYYEWLVGAVHFDNTCPGDSVGRDKRYKSSEKMGCVFATFLEGGSDNRVMLFLVRPFLRQWGPVLEGMAIRQAEKLDHGDRIIAGACNRSCTRRAV